MLDLKYRPDKFHKVLGNDGVKKLLLARSRGGSLDKQSMMLSGPKGCGKTTLARLIAKAIMCPVLDDGEPCGECGTCVDIANGVSSSVEELDAASQGTVDKMRSMVMDADYETIDGGVPVYIIDEAQRLTLAAQDAALKAIESRALIVIICTTEPHKIKGPIRSRVEEYPIRPPAEDDMLHHMCHICDVEGFTYKKSALEKIIKIHKCCPRSCLMSLNAIASVGAVNHVAVLEFFRFNSYELIVKALSVLNYDINKTFSLLGELFAKETPSWIRDNIIFAVVSCMRKSVGVESDFPVSIDSLRVGTKSRWVKACHDLSSINRPTAPNIEAVVMSLYEGSMVFSEPYEDRSPVYVKREPAVEVNDSASRLEGVSDKPPVVEKPESSEPVSGCRLEASSDLQPKAVNTEPKPKSKPKPTISTVEVDGIKFSSAENLTSLDDKVHNEKKVSVEKASEYAPVELNDGDVPITESQFINEFLETKW